MAGLLVAAGAAAALVVGRSSSDSKAAPTTIPTTPDGIAATSLEGKWAVTRTVSESDNPLQPPGSVSVVTYTVTKNCSASPCTLHVEAPGSFGAIEQSDLAFVTDHFEGPVTGSSPCLDTSGKPTGFAATITGSVTLATIQGAADQFTGTLQLHLQSGIGCTDVDHSLAFTLGGARSS